MCGPIKAPRREPGGRRAVGLFPAPGSHANRSPPTRPIRGHLTQARGGPVPSRRRFLRDQSASGGSVPAVASASLGELLASPSWLRSDFYAGSIGTRPPLANPDSARPRVGKGYRHLAALGASPLFHRSPPARAGGTAGRWAIPHSKATPRSPPPSPIRDHRHPCFGASPCHLAGRSLRDQSASGGSVPALPSARSMLARSRHPAFARQQRRLDWHGLTPREPVFSRARVDTIEAPRREPGGRRAVGPSRSPEAPANVRNQPAQNAITTDSTTGLHPTRQEKRVQAPRCARSQSPYPPRAPASHSSAQVRTLATPLRWQKSPSVSLALRSAL